MAKHRQHEHNERQRKRPPKSAPEIAPLRVFAFLKIRENRFKRHAAFRALAWMILPYFRMHWASVKCSTWCRRRRGSRRDNIFGRCRLKFRQTELATKAVEVPLIAVAKLSVFSDRHPAHWVSRLHMLIRASSMFVPVVVRTGIMCLVCGLVTRNAIDISLMRIRCRFVRRPNSAVLICHRALLIPLVSFLRRPTELPPVSRGEARRTLVPSCGRRFWPGSHKMTIL